ncbi:MAG: alpha/beta hydrolase [Cyanobacteria bacterium P01_A01_bin.80]
MWASTSIFTQKYPLGIVRKIVLGVFGLGCFFVPFTPAPSLGADRIAFYYSAFGEFTISTESLEIFAKEGRVTKELKFYTSRLSSTQESQLKELLSTRFELDPVLVSQFTYTSLGEKVLSRMGKILRNESRQDGMLSLRSAFIIAAAENPGGITVVDVLKRFPSPTLRINFQESIKAVGELSELFEQRDKIVAAIAQQSSQAPKPEGIDFAQLPDLRQPSKYGEVKIEELQLQDRKRNRSIPVDIYLPQRNQGRKPDTTPLVVISHGIAGDRRSFAHVGQHLSEYGFAVAVLEHPDDSSGKFDRFFKGLGGLPDPKRFINRPQEITLLLDELEQRKQRNPELFGNINVSEVGLIGHSMGGYTALALSGADLNLSLLEQKCPENTSFNVSTLLQCRATELSTPSSNTSISLQDKRVKAVLAINPVTSWLLGQEELSKVKIPAMIIAGKDDIVSPPIPEQIRPFTWLSSPEKYLVVIKGGTHFSVLNGETLEDKTIPVPPGFIGEQPEIASSHIKALSLAFMGKYLLNERRYAPYVSSAYAQFISKEPITLSLVESVVLDQLSDE